MVDAARRDGRAASIGLVGNAADVYPETLLARGIIPDIVTDQTSAHDLVYGYVPAGRSLAEVRRLRQDDPATLMRESRASIVRHVRAMLGFQARRRRGVRQRQPHPHPGPRRRRRRRLRHPDLHRGLSAPAVRPRHRPVPLDLARQRPRRHPQDRRPAARRLRQQPDPHQLDRARPRACAVRRPAGAHRLARPWRAHRARAHRQPHGARGRRFPAPSPSPAIISMPAPWRIPTS